MIVCVCTGFVCYEVESIDYANHTSLGGKGNNRKNFKL